MIWPANLMIKYAFKHLSMLESDFIKFIYYKTV